MADILTEAVKNGIDTSDMPKDMAKEVSALAMKTSGKSVDAALNIIKGLSGAKGQVSRGQMGTYHGLVTAQASQDLLMEKLNGPGGSDFKKSLLDKGIISKEQHEKLAQMKPGSTFGNVVEQIPGGAFSLLRQFTESRGDTDISKKIIENAKKQYGNTTEGFQRFSDVVTSQGGFNTTQGGLLAAWKNDGIGLNDKDIQKKGEGTKEERTKGVLKSRSAMGITQEIKMENKLIDLGLPFAQATERMQDSLLSLVTLGVKPVELAMIKVNEGLLKVITGLDTFKKNLDSFEEHRKSPKYAESFDYRM